MGNRFKILLRASIFVIAVGILIAEVASRGGAAAGIGALALLAGWILWKLTGALRFARKFQELAKQAGLASDAGQHAEALRSTTEALELARKRRFCATQGVATVLAIQSRAQQQLGKKQEALDSATKAFACMRAVTNPKVQMLILDQLGWMLLDQGCDRRAIPILEAASGLGARSGANRIERAARLERTGLAYLRVGSHANAVGAFGKAIELMTEEFGPDSDKLSGAYTNLGNAYKKSEKLQDAERCYREALRLYERNGVKDPEKVSINTLNLGVVCAESGRNEEAERLYLEVLHMRIEALGRNHWRVGNTYNNLAGCRRRMRDFDGAEEYLRQAIEILENRPESLSNVYDSLSRIREEQGRMEEALREAARAREIQQGRPSPDLSQLATLYEREALLASRTGDEERAKECRANAAQARATLAAVPAAGRDVSNLGDSLRTLEQNLESSLEHVKTTSQASPVA
jgi:tetratricopeptide (TPR) repeat protein